MAGLEHYRMSMDPAIQKLGNMTTNRHKFFRWTPRTARITFMYAVVVPVIFGVVAYTTDGKYDFRAKRKGDMIREF
ncbi:NADH:ubiquinone oxidoreductase 6.6kD subunit [Daldinia sp. FL1419]|nr:NADH:ubiquinone oxidoreductase 6.6kD subunit [Daldinia sp. FL1419]